MIILLLVLTLASCKWAHIHNWFQTKSRIWIPYGTQKHTRCYMCAMQCFWHHLADTSWYILLWICVLSTKTNIIELLCIIYALCMGCVFISSELIPLTTAGGIAGKWPQIFWQLTACLLQGEWRQIHRLWFEGLTQLIVVLVSLVVKTGDSVLCWAEGLGSLNFAIYLIG